MGIGEAYGHHLVSHSHHEGVVQAVGQVELFQRHLAALFHLGLVFAVLRVLQFEGRARAAALEFDFGSQHPVTVELIVAGYDKAWDGDGIAFQVAVARRRPVEAVDAIVLEGGHHFSVSAHAVASEGFILCGIVVPLCVCAQRSCQHGSYCCHSSVDVLHVSLVSVWRCKVTAFCPLGQYAKKMIFCSRTPLCHYSQMMILPFERGFGSHFAPPGGAANEEKYLTLR